MARFEHRCLSCGTIRMDNVESAPKCGHCGSSTILDADDEFSPWSKMDREILEEIENERKAKSESKV